MRDESAALGSVNAPAMPPSSPIRRFGAFLAPTIFVASALGILSAPESPSGSVAILHVELGLGLVVIAGWAFIVALRLGEVRSGALAGIAFFPALAIVIYASAAAVFGFAMSPLLDRVLALTSLAGAGLMVVLGSSRPRDRPAAASAPGGPFPTRTAGAVARTALPAVAVIAVLFLDFQGVATLVLASTGLPSSLPPSLVLQAAGALLLVASGALVLWVFRYRRPLDMIESTGATFSKLFGATHVQEWGGRTEPLVVTGPQRYVRHPLYLSVILMLVGWGCFSLSSVTLLEAAPFLGWFLAVQIPFEERELRTLYGSEYERYSRRTPRLLPGLRAPRE